MHPPVLPLISTFQRIATTRMRDLPFLNPHLSVEAVGFREWLGSWVGVLITPWGINLLQLPTVQGPFEAVRADAVIEVALPGGVMPFMPAYEPEVGDYRMCSLFSPAQQFADQSTAIAAAQAILEELFPPVSADQPDASRRRFFGLRT